MRRILVSICTALLIWAGVVTLLIPSISRPRAETRPRTVPDMASNDNNNNDGMLDSAAASIGSGSGSTQVNNARLASPPHARGIDARDEKLTASHSSSSNKWASSLANSTTTSDASTLSASVYPLSQGQRIVAIGDLHGSLRGLRGALKAANLIDLRERWIGGNSIVVQMGDVLDRGRNELEVILMLERLDREAQRVGGRVLSLLGNHDAMNINGFYAYSPNLTGFQPDRFKFGASKVDVDQARVVEKYAVRMRHRAAAFLPGGPAARFFARTRKGVVRVGDAVFVHAVFDAEHAGMGLDTINDLLAGWMKGTGVSKLPGSVWRLLQDRDYGRPLASMERLGACPVVAQALKLLNATRMVVAHTPQWTGINAACAGQLWRVDGGLSVMTSMNRPMEVLEILESKATVLSLAFPY